jgi:glycosyltransferase involved in cell wall biosynthesis
MKEQTTSNDKIISIMILSWNRLGYLKTTVDNILKKTTVPHEIIFSDNNSTEESGIRQYIDTISGNKYTQDITKIYSAKNLGVAQGRNVALKIARGQYLFNADDDVVVPDNWDIRIVEACDKIPKLGITGINVEPIKYPVKEINGVRVRPKEGNLGGAMLCIPRRVFKAVGYYRVFGQYGLEDSDMYVRLKTIGLMSAYIEPNGIHLDKDTDKVYRKVKDRAHSKGSQQLRAFAKAKLEYEKTKNVYIPYTEYDPDDKQWQYIESFDGTIVAKKDLRNIFDEHNETKGMKIGNKLEIEQLNKENKYIYTIDTGAEIRELPENITKSIYVECINNNVRITKTNLGD